MTTPPDEVAEALEVIGTIVVPPGKYEINGRMVELSHTVRVNADLTHKAAQSSPALDVAKPIEVMHHKLIGSVWRHVKTGNDYKIVGMCRLEQSNAPAFLYKDASGLIWARDMDEFLDGRFVKLEKDADAIGKGGGE